jgi:hypothetical protein
MLSAPSALAQQTASGTAVSGSGTTAGSGSTTLRSFSLQEIQRQEIARQWSARLQRTEDFRQQWLQERSFLTAMEIDKDQYLNRRSQRRAGCWSDIRKANKLGQFSAALDCYRGELTEDLSRLQKEREYVERVPGVSDDVRWLTLTRLDLLGDALAVIRNAIDSDVYQAMEEIQDAKQNLLISYRKPVWLMQTKLRADKLLTWTASILTRIGAMEGSTAEGETAERLYESVLCLTEAEKMLQDVLTSQEFEAADAKLALAQAHVQGCIVALQGGDITPPTTRESAVETTASPARPATSAAATTANGYEPNRLLQRRLDSVSSYRLSRNASAPTHGAANRSPVDTRMFLSGADEDVAASTCNGQPVSRRLLRRIGNTCNIANVE